MAGANGHKPSVGQRIEDAKRDCHSHGILEEVVIIYPISGLLPRTPIILEVSNPLLFLAVHADNGIAAGGEFAPLPIDAFELSIAHFLWRRVIVARFQAFVIDAQRETHFIQQAAHRLGTDLDVEPAQLLGDFLGRLSRPFQMVHRVAAGFVLQ